MERARSIVINGDLGSGKTAVAIDLARRLGLRRVSTGDLHREIARERRLTTLQLNRQAEDDREIDDAVDQILKDMATSNEQAVFDSRLAWFFIPQAFKVHLIADASVAARRVLSRSADGVEGYASLAEAREKLAERAESERVRFKAIYGADKHLLRNYDLVCDTTRATVDEVVDRIVGAFEGSIGDRVLREAPPLVLLDPMRLYPSQEIQSLRGLQRSEAFVEAGQSSPEALEPITVGYTGAHFYVVNGHRHLSTALHNGFSFVAAELVAERDERFVGNMTATQYFESEVKRSMIHDWEDANQVELPLPPHLQQQVDAYGS